MVLVVLVVSEWLAVASVYVMLVWWRFVAGCDVFVVVVNGV